MCARPTRSVGPYQLDARRCISYLTIELRGSIPEEYRTLIGNRIYGCDDCQLFCPWNKFAQPTAEGDFAPRNGLESALLTELFGWSEQEWQSRMAGSAIYRIGYEQWLRNIAVALGNAPPDAAVLTALQARAEHPSELVREHVAWALAQHATHERPRRLTAGTADYCGASPTRTLSISRTPPSRAAASTTRPSGPPSGTLRSAAERTATYSGCIPAAAMASAAAVSIAA